MDYKVIEYSLKGYYLDHYEAGHYTTKDIHNFNLVPKHKANSGADTTDDYGDHTLASKELKFWFIIWPSIVAQWLNLLTYVILLVIYLIDDDTGR